MVNIIQDAIAGTLESSDVLVTVSPASSRGINITVNSIVVQQFGDEIRRITDQIVANMGVSDVNIHIDDKGALECVLKARIQAAILRASGTDTIAWGNL